MTTRHRTSASEAADGVEPEGAPCFLLGSADRGSSSRYSFVGITAEPCAGAMACSGSRAGRPDRAAPDPYAAVAYSITSAPRPRSRASAIRWRMRSASWGIDLGAGDDPWRADPDRSGLPDAALMVTDVLLALDRLRRRWPSWPARRRGRGDQRGLRRAAGAIADIEDAPRRGPGSRRRGGVRATRSSTWSAGVRRRGGADRRCRSTPAMPSRWCRRSASGAGASVDAFSIYRGLRWSNHPRTCTSLTFGDFQIAGAASAGAAGQGAGPAVRRGRSRHLPARQPTRRRIAALPSGS